MSDKESTFFDLAMESKSLLLGDFTLKSGKKSPYFFNVGAFFEQGYIDKLADLYSELILESSISFDVIFGPAYKGIPLAAAISASLAVKTGKPVPFAFDRKEEKKHGEGGQIVGELKNKKILIVDEDENVRFFLRNLLEKHQYITSEAETAKEFFWKLGGEKFDLVLLDYGLPDLDGVEALKRLEMFSEDEVPNVLFVTAEEDPSILSTYTGSAVKGYVTKPIPVTSFIEKLEVLLRSKNDNQLAAIDCDVDILFISALLASPDFCHHSFGFCFLRFPFSCFAL